MGWKQINGDEYYYRSEREGGRVTTTYVGSGIAAQFAAMSDAEERAEREAERKVARAEREEAEAEERAVTEWFDDIQAVADAAMVAAGFHKHKGQWRRRRS
jgi:hypothetical protein